MDDYTWALLRLLVALPLVGALAYFSVRYGLGQRQQFSGSRYLRVVEQVSLGRQARVAVLQAGERYLLVGCGEGGVTLLAELADYQGPPAREGKNWVELYGRWRRGRAREGRHDG